MNILLVAPVLVPLATLLLGILLRARIRWHDSASAAAACCCWSA